MGYSLSIYYNAGWPENLPACRNTSAGRFGDIGWAMACPEIVFNLLKLQFRGFSIFLQIENLRKSEWVALNFQ